MLNRDLSDAINRLRMPLAFLVVCVHADFTKKFSYAGKQVNCAYDIGYHIVNFYLSHFGRYSCTSFLFNIRYVVLLFNQKAWISQSSRKKVYNIIIAIYYLEFDFFYNLFA